jgi:uncharacterized protein (TIGR02598 family)
VSRSSRGFSLVEVVLAVGIVAFALLSILALLPLGLQANRVSSQATRTECLLTALEADLRNTHPLANSGNSQYFGLPLPYTDPSGRVVLSTNLSTNTVYSIALNDSEQTLAEWTADPSPYKPLTFIPMFQVSVIYTRAPGIPPAGASTPGPNAPVEARLIASWPYNSAATALTLTSTGNGGGYVESYVSFPAP